MTPIDLSLVYHGAMKTAGPSSPYRWLWRVLTVLATAAVLALALGLVLAWPIVVGYSALRFEETGAPAIAAVSLQVALLAAFFFMVTFGIAVLAFFGYRTIHDTAVADAKREARDVAEDTVYKLQKRMTPDLPSPQQSDDEEIQEDEYS